MASYNSRSRDPLLDSTLQAALQKRGREALGLGLIALAGAIAMMLWTYAPSDPSWMSSSNVPVENALGRIGATISSPLMIIIGKAAWGLVLFSAVWGGRLLTSRGHELATARGIFLPIALAVSAVWCASLLPAASWGSLYGMGGVFGDTVLAAIVTALPMSAAAGVTLMGLVMLAVMLGTWAYVLGVTRPEAARFARFVMAGALVFAASLGARLRGGATGSVRAGGKLARRMQDGMAARAHARQADISAEAWHEDAQELPAHGGRAEPSLYRDASSRRNPPIMRPQGYPAPRPEEDIDIIETYRPDPSLPDADEPWTDDAPSPAQSPGLLARLKSLSARPAAPPAPDLLQVPLRGELVEPPLTAAAMQAQPAGEAHLRSRIADVIRHRKAGKPVLRFDKTRHTLAEPPLRKVPVSTEPPLAATALPDMPYSGARLDANVSAVQMDPVPMPDWMLAAQPDAPRPVAEAPVSQASPLVAEPLFQSEPPKAGQVLNRRVVTSVQRPVAPSRQARAEAEPALQFDTPAPVFELPPLSLLEHPSEVQRYTPSDEALEENARMLENVLEDYGVRGEIVSVRPGPVVTQYELEPAPGLKASRVIGLADDIARSMSALSARVSTVPGRTIIGIELPNVQREKVVLREILSTRDFGDSNMRLPLALGKAIDGEPIVANLAKMPHLLIAGTTGSGKSVAINTMILSLLYRLSPEDCRMIMIDPKML